jgi:hypothetical protein
VFLVAGFIVAYGLTLGDQVLGLALQPATAGNAPQFELPEIFFVPPTDALVRFLLWLSLAVVVPVALVIAANLLTGRDPALLLRRALAERLATSERFCAGESGAEHVLEAQAFEGMAQLRKFYDLAGGRRRLAWGISLIDNIARLGLLLLAWLRVGDDARDPLVPAPAVGRNRRCKTAKPRASNRSRSPRPAPPDRWQTRSPAHCKRSGRHWPEKRPQRRKHLTRRRRRNGCSRPMRSATLSMYTSLSSSRWL